MKGERNTGSIEGTGMRLWYCRPATLWADALPVGNGRLGAMLFGGPETERV